MHTRWIPASAALVHHLAASRDAVVLATVRSREASPDAVTALWKDELCDRLDLQPLSDRETGDLLRQVLDGEVDVRTRHDLWEATQGNLLFLRELVGEGLASGAFALQDGLWRWVGRRSTHLQGSPSSSPHSSTRLTTPSATPSSWSH